jgi:hypothetical protein
VWRFTILLERNPPVVVIASTLTEAIAQARRQNPKAGRLMSYQAVRLR